MNLTKLIGGDALERLEANMNTIVFELVDNDKTQVILKVNAKDTLTVARHPYISMDYEYITLTKGINHILTTVRKDGKTFSFSWGFCGGTLISENLMRLKDEVCKYLDYIGIDIGQ